MATQELDLDLTTVCFIIQKARELEVQADVVSPDYGEEARAVAGQVISAYAEDPNFSAAREAIEELGFDDQCRLVALAWLGRGDYTLDDWDDAVQLARSEHTDHTAAYLLGMPLLANYLEEGLNAFDLSCDGV